MRSDVVTREPAVQEVALGAAASDTPPCELIAAAGHAAHPVRRHCPRPRRGGLVAGGTRLRPELPGGLRVRRALRALLRARPGAGRRPTRRSSAGASGSTGTPTASRATGWSTRRRASASCRSTRRCPARTRARAARRPHNLAAPLPTSAFAPPPNLAGDGTMPPAMGQPPQAVVAAGATPPRAAGTQAPGEQCTQAVRSGGTAAARAAPTARARRATAPTRRASRAASRTSARCPEACGRHVGHAHDGSGSRLGFVNRRGAEDTERRQGERRRRTGNGLSD